MDRRTFILAVGTGTIATLAGCNSLGGGGGSGDADTGSPESVVESFYDIGDGLDPESSADEIVDAISPVLHSASPLPELLEQSEDENEDNQLNDIDSIETEVTQENLTVAELEEYGLGVFGVSDEDIESIAEENAIVNASVEYAEAEAEEVEHVTATEDGDWLLIF